jgi:hypothetical protein
VRRVVGSYLVPLEDGAYQVFASRRAFAKSGDHVANRSWTFSEDGTVIGEGSSGVDRGDGSFIPGVGVQLLGVSSDVLAFGEDPLTARRIPADPDQEVTQVAPHFATDRPRVRGTASTLLENGDMTLVWG